MIVQIALLPDDPPPMSEPRFYVERRVGDPEGRGDPWRGAMDFVVDRETGFGVNLGRKAAIVAAEANTIAVVPQTCWCKDDPARPDVHPCADRGHIESAPTISQASLNVWARKPSLTDKRAASAKAEADDDEDEENED